NIKIIFLDVRNSFYTLRNDFYTLENDFLTERNQSFASKNLAFAENNARQTGGAACPGRAHTVKTSGCVCAVKLDAGEDEAHRSVVHETVEACAFRRVFLRADAEAARGERRQLLHAVEQELPFAQDDARAAGPRAVVAIVPDKGRPLRRVRELARPLVTLVRVPVAAVRRLDHLAVLAAKSQCEQLEVRVLDEEAI